MASFFSNHSARETFFQAPLGQQIAWLAQALGLSLIWLGSGALSPDRASAAGRRVMRLLGPRLRRTATIKRNLTLAFPHKAKSEIDQLAAEIWGNLGAVLAEYPHLSSIRGNLDESRIEVRIEGGIESLENPRQPAIFVTAHLGNWELAAAATVNQGVPLSVIHSEQGNPLILAMVQRRRQPLGCGFVSKEAGLRPIVRLLEKGTSVGLLPDQKIRTGEPLPFFARPALTTPNPARLALKYHCQLVPIQVERLEGAHFRVTFHRPVTADDREADRATQARQMTSRVNALFESWIRAHPDQWWCPKNRWPKPGRDIHGNRLG